MSDQNPGNKDNAASRSVRSTEVPRKYSPPARGAKKGLLGRFNTRFNDALQNSRGAGRRPDVAAEARNQSNTRGDGPALRRARNANTTKMVIPEGVTIEGHLTGGTDTDISGRI